MSRRLITSLLLPAAVAVGVAGCGGSSSPSVKAGTYSGLTSQREGIGIVIAPGAKAISGIAVKMKYKCTHGATSETANASGPTVSVPLHNGAFTASWTTYGVNKFRITGSFNGTAGHGTLVSVSPDDIGGGNCKSGTVTWQAKPAAKAAALARPSGKQALTTAGEIYNASLVDAALKVKTDAKANNVSGFKSDVAQIRNALYEFDSQVRKMSFPASVQPQLNTLLLADRAEIADLDGVGSATTTSGMEQSWNRAAADQSKTTAAEHALRDAS